MRHDQCKKTELKAVLWQEIEHLIKNNVDLQTSEVPDFKSTKSAGSSKSGEQWELDEVDLLVKAEFPSLTVEQIYAHKFVDELLVARFVAGTYDMAVALDKEGNHRDTKELLNTLVCICLLSMCLPECFRTKQNVQCLCF